MNRTLRVSISWILLLGFCAVALLMIFAPIRQIRAHNEAVNASAK